MAATSPPAGAASLTAEKSHSDGGFPSDGEQSAGHDTEFKEQVSDLTFDEYTAGGLGRHLGVFSTTSLMSVRPLTLLSKETT